MAEKTPVRVNFDNSNNAVGFAEYQSADFIGLDDGGTGGSYASLAALLEGIGLGTSDSPTFTGITTSGNVTIGGNLTVDGSTTTVNSTITTLDDPIITLGGDTAPASDDNKDRGVEFRYHTGSGAKIGFFGFDDSSGKFTFIPDATNTAEVFSGSVGTIVANLEGNVTGTVSSLSGLDTDNLTEGSSNLYFTNERVDDRIGALLIDSATSGIDINYDDANNQLTISADLGEITTDLNERVDDRVDSLLTAGSNVSLTYDDAAGTLTIASTDTNTQLTTEQVQDIVGGMVDGGTETNVAVTYDDTSGKLNFVVSQLTSEQVQDIIGPMFASNTETFITVTYDDSDGTLDLVVPVLDEDNMASDSASHLATQQSIKAYVDSQVQTEESIEDFVGGMITGNTETLITVTYDDSDGTMDFVVDNDLANYDNTNSGFITATLTTEEVQDIIGGMVSSNTETNIAVTYDDTNGKLDFVSTDTQLSSEQVQDIVGAMFSSNTETNITATYQDSDGTIDLVADLLTEEAVEDFVAGLVVGGTNVTATYDDAAGTLTLDATDTNTQLTQEQVEDFVGGMISGTQTFITVGYDDTGGNLTYVVPVKDEDNMASDSASHLATQQSIKAYVDTQLTAEDLDVTADSGGPISIDLDSETLDIAGGTGITTTASGNEISVAIDSTVVTESSTDTLTNKTISFEDNTAIIEFVVTVANPGSGNKFYLDGELSANVQLIPGITYRFNQSDNSNSGHPLRLSTTKNGTHGGGSAYTTGVTINGSAGNSGGYTQIVVNAATADKLYYYCSSHSGMGGDSVISVQGSSFVAGTGISISGETISSTITQYADSDVQSYLSGGTGVTLSGSGEFSIGQAVATSSNVTFADLAATGNVTITGNLDVNGTTTTLDTTNSTIADRLIELGTGTTGTPANDMGIVLERGSSDNAFIGWDESADKFIVGTGSFTGASTGDLTISTGTLLANIEGNVTGNVTGNVSGSSGSTTGNAATATALANARTIGGVSFDGSANINLPGVNTSGSQDTSGNAATATALATGRTIGMTGDVVWTSASFDGSGNVTGSATIQSGAVETAMLNANVITGQTAETSIDDDDLILIYDDSASALRKMTKANFTAGLSGGGGTVTEAFRTIAVSGQTDIVADSATDSLTFAAGSNISLSTNASTDTVTIATDSTASPDFAGLTLTDTNANANQAPLLKLFRNSASPAAGDDLGVLRFTGENSSGSETIYGFIQAEIDNPSNSTGRLRFGSGDSGGVYRVDISNQGIELSAGSDIYFEGSSSNDFETKLTVTNPTADRTVTLPDATGTVILSSSSIGDLSDVDITSSAPSDGQALVFNASNNEFEPGTVASSTNLFQTIAVSGQSPIVADSTTDTLTFAAGANITLTTNASSDTLTIAATGGAANAFSTFAVSGQSNVVADSTTDTMTFVAGTGMTLTTDASGDSITFTSAATGGGIMPFTEFDGSTDNIVLSSAATGGALPVTLAGGSSDPINMTGTTQTLTSYADNDDDTKVEVERTSDNDTVHIKAGGTDVITATSSGVTITNLTVSGTTTQANELKITDTLFELNADGGSLTTDAGMIIERGSTGDNAALIWDESTDSFIAGTTATDGSASSNLTVTEADLKAKTQNQSDNSTKVATTAYVDTALGSLSSNSITDADSDTKIQVEESSDEDIIRADTGGQERVTIDNNVSMSSRGGFFTHNLTMHSSETFTISSTEGTVAAGPLDVQGTVDVQGSLVIL